MQPFSIYMKIAIVFDDLIQNGGAEKLLFTAHEVWPEAPIYTCFASKKWINYCEKNKIKLVTSFMQNIPFAETLNKVLAAIGLHVLAYETFTFDKFDTVLSISARFAHGIITKPATRHICYMNSPGRMIWEPVNYFENAHLWSFLTPFLTHLRIWDYSAAHRVDVFIANSKTPQERISKYYGRLSTVVYPYADSSANLSKQRFDKNYFLIISRLVSWKKIDVAIKACVKQNFQLKIVGAGGDLLRLQNLAGTSSLIEFCGRVSDSQRNELLLNCTALIQPQYEDFGITPVEAMAYGKPVIAFGKGGALETVIPGVTGEFFMEQSPDCLGTLLHSFNSRKYTPEACISQSKVFSKQRFIKELQMHVN